MISKPFTIRGFSSAAVWEHENAYHWFSEPARMHKLLAHWELYRRIVNLPGLVVECGVYKAASLIRWATFRDGLEAARARRIVCFDAFGAFPRSEIAGDEDRAFIERFESGGEGLTQEEVRAVLAHKGLETNVELHAGDVRETVPRYLAAHPATRIALLHLDMDVYEPTAFALERFWPLLVPGGVVVIDDYNGVEGATRAVDEWREKYPQVRLEKVPFAHTPTFAVKP
jgi:hypothetical protein